MNLDEELIGTFDSTQQTQQTQQERDDWRQDTGKSNPIFEQSEELLDPRYEKPVGLMETSIFNPYDTEPESYMRPTLSSPKRHDSPEMGNISPLRESSRESRQNPTNRKSSGKRQDDELSEPEYTVIRKTFYELGDPILSSSEQKSHYIDYDRLPTIEIVPSKNQYMSDLYVKYDNRNLLSIYQFDRDVRTLENLKKNCSEYYVCLRKKDTQYIVQSRISGKIITQFENFSIYREIIKAYCIVKAFNDFHKRYMAHLDIIPESFVYAKNFQKQLGIKILFFRNTVERFAQIRIQSRAKWEKMNKKFLLSPEIYFTRDRYVLHRFISLIPNLQKIDVFMIGVVLFRNLTGREFYTAEFDFDSYIHDTNNFMKRLWDGTESIISDKYMKRYKEVVIVMLSPFDKRLVLDPLIDEIKQILVELRLLDTQKISFD